MSETEYRGVDRQETRGTKVTRRKKFWSTSPRSNNPKEAKIKSWRHLLFYSLPFSWVRWAVQWTLPSPIFINVVAEVFLKATFSSYMKVCGLQEEIEISEGRVRGMSLKTLEGQEFLSVEGIPYAEPPVGPLRWMPPTRLLLVLYRSCLYFDYFSFFSFFLIVAVFFIAVAVPHQCNAWMPQPGRALGRVF